MLSILNDSDLMADRGRIAVIDERLELIVKAINNECRVLRDNFSACSEMGSSNLLHVEEESHVVDRVHKLYALHSERSALIRKRAELATVIAQITSRLYSV